MEMRYPNGYPSNLTTSYDETSLQTNDHCAQLGYLPLMHCFQYYAN